ncbi:MAG: SDR family oxidoreductase [Pelagibacteraceae bacterium]|jgi:NAD(P)-dependent dehydrogenase (short-subunit alcohol dehydrogenase family)|nr:SDR family oxidoreductase [Pelagibacteraceae bacterium]MBT3902159.1 SDR family oxidoreductase [Pelagibacteraceae bacterium]MBT4646207.1 SDR family oxidoreductase [Pelagibacteraceae bacterium]MBT4951162.1 SDR family oxidoreductase [Pelagibacteraceae bacterium]MBT5214561.1 SDR family oxidoreductase [Pelagibacteraceae bacterium]
METLKNKVAVVTGVGSGIGKAIAMAYAEAGALLGVGDINENLLLKTTEDLKDKNENIISLKTDVSNEEQVKKLIDETVNAHGKLDIIVNNVSVAIGGYPITDMSNEDWQKIIGINFSSVFYGCKHSIPYLKKNNGGSIINIASVQAHNPLPGWAAYAGIKGGVISMTRNIASEFGPYNIRANTISPGTIATEMVNQVLEEDGTGTLMDDFILMHPIGRIGKPSEIAATAVFLASEGGAFANGEDFRIDGGLVITPRTRPGAGSNSKE